MTFTRRCQQFDQPPTWGDFAGIELQRQMWPEGWKWELAFGLTLLTMAYAIGLSLTLIHLISIPVTNTPVNPARSTGPAIFVGDWALSLLWFFWVFPLIGAALAGTPHSKPSMSAISIHLYEHNTLA